MRIYTLLLSLFVLLAPLIGLAGEEASSIEPKVQTHTPKLNDKEKLEASRLESLESMRWQYRVLLLDARGGVSRQSQYLSNLGQNKAQIDERDIAWFIVSDLGLTSNITAKPSKSLVQSINKQLLKVQLTEPSCRVQLLGKDGGIKACAKALDLKGIFALIDSMPMRRREMNLPSN